VEEINEVIEALQQQYLEKLKAKGIDLSQAQVRTVVLLASSVFIAIHRSHPFTVTRAHWCVPTRPTLAWPLWTTTARAMTMKMMMRYTAWQNYCK
jgi:hypothetical protein